MMGCVKNDEVMCVKTDAVVCEMTRRREGGRIVQYKTVQYSTV